MKLNLKSICIVGLIVSILVIIDNIFVQFFRDDKAEFVYNNAGLGIRKTILYSLVAAHYLALCFYLFKKRYLFTGLVWIIQFFSIIWFVYVVESHELIYDFNQVRWIIYTKSIITILTGCVFAIGLSRTHFWLGIFGVVLAVSVLPSLASIFPILSSSFFELFICLIPLPVVINYWLELKNLKGVRRNYDVDSEIIDVEI
jgi:hypothetical protein